MKRDNHTYYYYKPIGSFCFWFRIVCGARVDKNKWKDKTSVGKDIRLNGRHKEKSIFALHTWHPHDISSAIYYLIEYFILLLNMKYEMLYLIVVNNFVI